MPALELLTGFTIAPGANLAGVTMASGNTLAVRNGREDSIIRLLQVWADLQVGGTVRIRSPRMHDNVQGVRLQTVATELEPMLPDGIGIDVKSQDVLTVEASGSAVAGDIETVCALAYYEDLPGINGRFAAPEDIRGRQKNLMTIEHTITFGALGGYSGERAINADFDLWKANTDYALLGFLTNTECAAIGIRGVDSGNLRVGCPGMVESKGLMARWFVALSERFDLPLIPIFNSANKSGILIDGVQDENAGVAKVTTIWAELGE
jgi:hypothetical protein